jgi:hypothetical protein
MVRFRHQGKCNRGLILYRFNSYMVRFSNRPTTQVDVFKKFQFLHGTISSLDLIGYGLIVKFQFLNGAIRPS